MQCLPFLILVLCLFATPVRGQQGASYPTPVEGDISNETRGHGTHSMPSIWGRYLAELLAESE